MNSASANYETESQDLNGFGILHLPPSEDIAYRRKQKTEKEGIVAPPDAVVHPLTMVVAVVDTVIAL
jgi:hypothetical protein